MTSLHKTILSGFSLVLVLLTAASAESATVVANDFQLLGANGKLAARLTMSGEGTPALFFFDQQGHNRMNLAMYPEGVGGLIMNDPEGRAVAVLRLHGKNERPVLVMKSKGENRMVMGLSDDEGGQPYIEPMPGSVSSPPVQAAGATTPIWLQVAISALAGFAGGWIARRVS